MRWVAAILLAGCAELGVVGDGTSISMGKAHQGYLVDGVRMPDAGEGFVTKEIWRARGNRYGTDELVDLLTGVSRRMHARWKERIGIADLSHAGGGPVRTWHASHQSGRDVDLLYYVRDKQGNPVEPDKMVQFDEQGRARDSSGYTVDVSRMWQLIREFLLAPEAPVQFLFLYEPLTKRVIEHAQKIGEPDALVQRARKALRQPGSAAPHDDHMHVRIFCPTADKAYGCIDTGPMDLIAGRDGTIHMIELPQAPAQQPTPAGPPTTAPTAGKGDYRALGKLLRSIDRIWR
jgi:penicillin-insensitive murein endopeptidase